MISRSNGILLKCGGQQHVFRGEGEGVRELKLDYKDEKSGEYVCVDSNGVTQSQIYVKFRSKFRAAGGFYSIC